MDFVKIVVFPKENHDFHWFGKTQIAEKTTKNRTKNKAKKREGKKEKKERKKRRKLEKKSIKKESEKKSERREGTEGALSKLCDLTLRRHMFKGRLPWKPPLFALRTVGFIDAWLKKVV